MVYVEFLQISPFAQIVFLNPKKCTEIVGGWGFAPDPTGGAYSAPPEPLAGLRGPTSKGPTSKGRGGTEGEERGGEARGGEGRGFYCVIVLEG